jgi:hypothetical protein
MKSPEDQRRQELQDKIDQIPGFRNYYDDHVEVRKNKYGHGVFASRRFLPGELIFEITGQYLAKKNYLVSDYVMDLNKNWFLEPTIPAAFLNHSCSPNAEMIEIDKNTLGLVAICNIEEESQITFDYQWEARDWIPRCRCGALNCRGWVVAKEFVGEMEQYAKKAKKK